MCVYKLYVYIYCTCFLTGLHIIHMIGFYCLKIMNLKNQTVGIHRNILGNQQQLWIYIIQKVAHSLGLVGANSSNFSHFSLHPYGPGGKAVSPPI